MFVPSNNNNDMKALNYKALTACNPTVFDTIVNQEGQTIELVEHPSLGDTYPIIAVCHELEVAACTDFWDTDDFYTDSDYNPVYMYGQFQCSFEVS